MASTFDTEEGQFLARWSLPEEALDLLVGLPPNVKEAVLTKFDGSGTKDGNVMGRLKGYIASQCRRNGVALQPSSEGGLQVAEDDETQIQNFVKKWGLGENAIALLRNVAPDVLSNVLMNFDGSNTKDGNVFGRLQAYLGRRNRGAGPVPLPGQVGVAQPPLAPLLTIDHTQMALYSQFYAHPFAPAQALLQQQAVAQSALISEEEVFLQKWGLGEDALVLLESVPGAVKQAVLRGFDGSGTKDGNVLGRLKGYIASHLKRAGLPASGTLGTQLLPQPAHTAVASQLSPLAIPSALPLQPPFSIYPLALPLASPLLASPLLAAQGPQLQQIQQPIQSLMPMMPTSPEEVRFAMRWNMGNDALQLLAALPPDAKQDVLENFEGSGAKDGNVLGCLEGFIATVLRKRGASKIKADQQLEAKRARLEA